MKETCKIINDLFRKKISHKVILSDRVYERWINHLWKYEFCEHFNSFFANIDPTLAKDIPKSNRHVESFLGDRVTDSIFLNPVTHEELLDIVHNAKDMKSKGYDGVDMCMLKKVILTS